MNTTEDLAQLEGRVVNERFRLLRWLGGSKTSSVYLAEFDDNPPRMAALKLVAAIAPDAESRLSGWIAAGRLSHPNLIVVIDCGRCEIDGSQFVYEVMEFAEEVLAEILPVRPLTADETRAMLGPVLSALRYLNAQGCVHGHIKPSNILVVDDRLKLSADAIALSGGDLAERAEMSVYDAPEQARGAVSPAADMWALGMSLVAALTQKPAPWAHGIENDPNIPPGLAEPFAQIAKACLRLDPAQRCTLDELTAILEHPELEHKLEHAIKYQLEPAIEYRPAPPVEASRQQAIEPQDRTNRASNLKAALISLAVVAVIAVAALIVRKSEFPASEPKGAEQQTSAPQTGQTQTPQAAIEKPSPSGRDGQTPGNEMPAGPVPAGARGAGGEGVVKRVIPDVPPAALQSIRGHVDVSVRLTVDGVGDVTEANLESPSRSNYFNRVAVDAARQWKFAAMASEATVAGTWSVHFEFRQDGIDAGAGPE